MFFLLREVTRHTGYPEKKIIQIKESILTVVYLPLKRRILPQVQRVDLMFKQNYLHLLSLQKYYKYSTKKNLF